jgi:hypothetical protein
MRISLDTAGNAAPRALHSLRTDVAYWPIASFRAAHQARRFGSEADSGLGGSQASEERARIYFGPSIGPTYGVEKLATPDFKLLDLKGKPPSRFTGPRVNHRAPSPS